MFKKIKEQIFENTASFRTLELPITLRILSSNEAPMDKNVLAEIKKSENAKIIEGYTIKNKDNNPEYSNLEFEFYSEINIDNSRLWELFNELANFLPSEVMLLSGHIDDEEVNYGSYFNKSGILDFLNIYKKELMNDVFLKFGLLFYSDSQFLEMFVDETKYIKFWGSDIQTFEDLLKSFGLKNIKDLEFIDQYPKVRHSLITFDENVTDTDKLLEILKNQYK